jgi:hypothetical protein
LLVRQILERHRRRADPGIVEQQIEPAERLLRLGEERANGCGITDIGPDDERARPDDFPPWPCVQESLRRPARATA